MGFLRNFNARPYPIEKRIVRFSILTTNPLIRRKVTHDSEVTKYRYKVDERFDRYNRSY